RRSEEAQIVVKADGESLGAEAWIIDGNVRSNETRVSDEIVTIKIHAIDDVVPADRHVSLIHLDIEGYEPAALDGALRTIQRCRPILIVEVYFSDQEWLLTKLGPLGY